MNSFCAGSELSFFVSVQIQFNDLFDTVLAKDYRNTDANVFIRESEIRFVYR